MEGVTMKVKRWVLAVAAAVMVLTTTSAVASQSCGNRADLGRGSRLTILGLTDDQRLVYFRECRPENLYEIGTVYGLQSPDTALVGIDFRSKGGQLYGVGNGGGIYTIDPYTAQATLVSQLTDSTNNPVILAGTFFGVDFNPAADRLRIISDTGQNLAHNVDLKLGGTAVNMALNYPAPVNINPALGVTGAAYTNNDLSDTTATTLFDIDTMRNQVAIQSPPAQGALVAVGSLTVDPNTPVGFDIYTDLKDGVAFNNRGFASLLVGGVSGFYRVNILTGQALLIGTFKDKVIDIAIPLNQ
jgi:uncharacterized membrane protein (UPF0136 family)